GRSALAHDADVAPHADAQKAAAADALGHGRLGAHGVHGRPGVLDGADVGEQHALEARADRPHRLVGVLRLLDLDHAAQARELEGAAEIVEIVQVERRVLGGELDIVVLPGMADQLDQAGPRREDVRTHGRLAGVEFFAEQIAAHDVPPMWLARSVRDRLQRGKRGEGLLKQIKITAMTVFVTDIPVRLMRRHGSGDVAGSVKNAILKLETDAGITGWGDAAPWAVFTGTIEANVAALHVYLRPLLSGADPHRIEDLMVAADHAVVGHPEAKAAMEMALFDIVGQASGLPVAEILGGRCRDDIALSFSVADPDFDRDMAMVKRLYDEGIRLFKIKTGFA